jgi:predicted dehydrogenase/threonine dehydrogenase-like Zn-dependent dehydrogenase
MAMKQVLISQGQAILEEVPAPQVEKGTVLVRVENSCISVGTEMSGLKTSSLPLWKRALKQPQNLKKVVDMALSQGVSKTYSLVQGRLASGAATGYSAAGTVIAVGEGIDDIEVGDRVACAGAQCAHHAEFIRVPRNLTVPLPDNLGFPSASSVTLGAIALQGVRRAQPTLGETFVVVGLGILGQLTVQFLKANGCKVIGTDLDESRVKMALTLGADFGMTPKDGTPPEQVARLTDGLGADGVIITAASPSNEIMSTAFKMCRRKGRVVLVGDVGLNLNRADFYAKEIDFFISTSYGPGRYDANYEERGLDYPASYVRWTENRNMLEYLNLVASGKVNVDAMVSRTYPLEQVGEAYESLKTPGEKPLMVLLQYAAPRDGEIKRTVLNPRATPAGKGRVRVALVGAGGFAKGMHLPNLDALPNLFHIQAIASRTGLNAVATAKQFNAQYGTTEYEKILTDPDVDAVIIATRHDLHASMALAALKAGKHVLLEKPLAVNRAELAQFETYFAAGGPGTQKKVLLTGFNRRFSRFAVRAQEIARNRSAPLIINYQMNAGHIPLDHWVHGPEGGGRNIGEACHIYDLFSFFTGAKMVSVKAQSVKPATHYYSKTDNFVANVSFDDGSVCNLIYTALGSKEYPKERMELYCDGKILLLEDYKSLKVFGAKHGGVETTFHEKGQKEELEAFAKAIQDGGEWPIPLWQQIQTTEISFLVDEQIKE